MSASKNRPAGGKMVSVCIATYNHEAYISETLEGILAQETEWPIEVIIAEDCSTDSTRAICRKYRSKYPEKVKVLERERNLGMMTNFILALAECEGKYIALCDGDDYWTDPLKLQKQVEFLEANPDFAVCFHRVKVDYEGAPKRSYLSNPGQTAVTTFEDLAKRNFIHTPSVVFRSGLFDALPDWYGESAVGDYPLHLLNAAHGKIAFLPDVMAVYRVHRAGMWGWQDAQITARKFGDTVKMCKNHFAPRAAKEFDQALADIELAHCFFMFENGKYKDFQDSYSSNIRYAWKTSMMTAVSLTAKALASRVTILGDAYRFLLFRWRGRHW